MQTEINIKKKIFKCAKQVRTIRKKQVTPIEDSIITHLMELYPLSEDNATNWMCDIVDSENDVEIADKFKRIENIFKN